MHERQLGAAHNPDFFTIVLCLNPDSSSPPLFNNPPIKLFSDARYVKGKGKIIMELSDNVWLHFR
jgi:hypothetical protein